MHSECVIHEDKRVNERVQHCAKRKKKKTERKKEISNEGQGEGAREREREREGGRGNDIAIMCNQALLTDSVCTLRRGRSFGTIVDPAQS